MRLSRDGFLTAILVVAALFVGSFVTSRMPNPDSLLTERPFLHDVGLNQTVELRTGSVTVTRIETAKQVEIYSQVAASEGVWLVATVRWSPVGEPELIGGSQPVVRAADGRTFGGIQAVTNNCGSTQPGLMVQCQLAFEVAPDALQGAHLLIPAGSSVTASDDVAEIDLGIDAIIADELSQTDAHISLQLSEVVAP